MRHCFKLLVLILQLMTEGEALAHRKPSKIWVGGRWTYGPDIPHVHGVREPTSRTGPNMNRGDGDRTYFSFTLCNKTNGYVEYAIKPDGGSPVRGGVESRSCSRDYRFIECAGIQCRTRPQVYWRRSPNSRSAVSDYVGNRRGRHTVYAFVDRGGRIRLAEME